MAITLDFQRESLTIYATEPLSTGKKLRFLTIVDIHSRYCPATDPRFSYRGEDVVQTLERICHEIGYPSTIRVDNSLPRT